MQMINKIKQQANNNVDKRDNVSLSEYYLRICNSVSKALLFIANSQFPSGEFPSYVANNIEMKNYSYIKTIAITVLVADCLKHVKGIFNVKQMINKSIEFLINEKEDEMKWRFFGKGSNIITDLEDVCYVLAFLEENKIDLNYEKFAEELLEYRNADGLFYTWFPEKGENNNVDWVTNTNILYFFYHNKKKSIPEVENYLRSIITEKKFTRGSLYYHSPYSFLYFFTRLYRDGNAGNFDSVIPLIEKFLLEKKVRNRWSSKLNYIFATIGLINCNYDGPILRKSINKVLELQNHDGSWPIGSIFRHRTIKRYYGSTVFSTALAIELLVKYFSRYNNAT